MRRVLGVLGGMGPAATDLFLDELTAHTDALTDQGHVDVVALNHASLPDRSGALGAGAQDSQALGELLARDAMRLERAGAEVLAMPCNTAHAWLARIRAAVSVPCLDMVAAAAARAAQLRPGGKVGVLATAGTRAAGLYDRACALRGLVACWPGPRGQDALTGLIYDHLKQGERTGDRLDELFAQACGDVARQGCDLVLLGCTELSLYRPGTPLGLPCVDALLELARASVEACGATWKDL